MRVVLILDVSDGSQGTNSPATGKQVAPMRFILGRWPGK